MEESSITNIPKLIVPDNLFNSNKIQIAENMFKEETKPDPKLGYTEELNNAKNEITPYADKWDKSIKFLLSDFELIDIWRNPKYSYQRYNEPIIKYREKWDKDESKGRYPIFSRAYFKVWEVICNTGVLKRYEGKALTVANVAEGPGGFIHCLIDYRKLQNGFEWNKDSYHGITLKIGKDNDAKALDWDSPRAAEYFSHVRSNGHNVVLSYGSDGTGNMFKLENLEHFVNKDLQGKKCQLVTGDGGIELSGDDEYAIQELANSPLFFSEILYALHVQEENGSFVLKIYDIYYNITFQLIMLLKLYYQTVTIVKPHTSRPASSEKYLVCENFKGISEDDLKLLKELLQKWVGHSGLWNGLSKQTFTETILDFDVDQSHIEEFRKQLAEFNTIFSDFQIKKIKLGLELAAKSDISTMEVKERQKKIAIEWCKAYNMPYKDDLVLSVNSSKSTDNRYNNYNNYNKHNNQRSGHYSRDYSRDYRNSNRRDTKRYKSRSRSRSRSRSYNRDRGYDSKRKGHGQTKYNRRDSRSRSQERQNKSSITFDKNELDDEVEKQKRLERQKRFAQ